MIRNLQVVMESIVILANSLVRKLVKDIEELIKEGIKH